MTHWRRRWSARLAIAAAGLVLALLLVELGLRLMPLDWQAVRRNMPRMDKELQVHRPVADPRLLIQLRPGARATFDGPLGRFTVTVNQLGFRGARRTVAREPGVMRVICVGGSNVYGAGLNDDQTWPARLEQRLNKRGDRRYEVWNLGVSGYNSLQLAVVARQALERYKPDLLIFAMSNWGPRYFLETHPDLASTFAKDPTLWQELLPPAQLSAPAWPSQQTKLWLLGRSALYRLVELGRLGSRGQQPGKVPPSIDQRYVAHTRPLLQQAARSARVVVFICPAVQPRNKFEAHYRGLGLPVLSLDAGDQPAEYGQFHPPARVMQWYAERMEAWLGARGMLAPVR